MGRSKLEQTAAFFRLSLCCKLYGKKLQKPLGKLVIRDQSEESENAEEEERW